MYGMKPIITQLVSQLHTEYENGLMKAVQGVCFDVDKERLLQAITDAQKFYVEGYNDAMANHDVVKVVRCKDCKHQGDPMACPMCHEEYYFDEDDGGDYFTVDRTVDDGFCHAGERWDTDA